MYQEEEKSYNDIVRENITAERRKRGWSTRDLGSKVGVSAMSISNWEKGKVKVSPEQVDKLCKAFNMTRAEFTTDPEAVPNLSIPAAYPLPILGTICAGDGIMSDENFEGYFFVDRTIKADYCLNVEGDSMIDANIFHGDVAFIKKSFDVLDGQIYAVRYGDMENAVIKKVYRQDNSIMLVSCNENYKPIITDDFFIVGEVVGVYHPR